MANDKKSLNFDPPKAVQKAFARGLALKDAHGGKGLQEGTLRWAEHFGAGKPSEPAQALRMRAWFHRHKVDKKAGWDKPPTPGYVAWLLWGGDAGQAWAERLAALVEKHGLAKAEPAKAAAAGPRKARSKKKAKGQKKTSSKKKVGRKATAKKPMKKAKATTKAKAATTKKRAAKTTSKKPTK